MDISKNLKDLFSLEDKVVLFTGAAGGIGSEMCKGLAGLGAKVALCDISLENAQAVEKEIVADGGIAAAFALELPHTDSIKDCIAAVLEKFGQIDVLVNCAGINVRLGALDVSEETYDKMMGINLKGAFFLSQEVGRHMVTRKKGSIVNVGSTNGMVNILGGCSVYGATKCGIDSLTRSLSIELAKHGIRANTIAPGAFKTPLSEAYWADTDKSGFLLGRIAMNRPGVPNELFGMMALLCSDASSYMTGGSYIVDGGIRAGGQTWPYDTEY